MSFWISSGVDRADGVTPLPAQPQGATGGSKTVGTPDPDGGRTKFGDVSNTDVEEEVDSPEIERAEQCTAQHRFKTSYSNGLFLLDGLGRGTFLQDTLGKVYRVLSSKIQSMRGGDRCSLTVTTESVSFDSPPDEFQLIPVELGIDILKHPRYSWAINPIPTDSSTFTTVGDTQIFYTDIKESIIRMVQTYRDSPFFPSANQINGLVQSNILSQIKNGSIDTQVPNPDVDLGQPILSGSDPNKSNRWNGKTANKPPGNFLYYIVSVPVSASPSDPVRIALAAAREIIYKLWRQEDNPYVVGFQITWSQFFFRPVYEDPGGYIQSPVIFVPDYFISPDSSISLVPRGDLTSSFGNNDTVAPAGTGRSTLFDLMATINPQSYSDDGTSSGNVNISWLRKADEVEYQRTWFKVTHTWIGSPIGLWDTNLYTKSDRPQDANDFQATF